MDPVINNNPIPTTEIVPSNKGKRVKAVIATIILLTLLFAVPLLASKLNLFRGDIRQRADGNSTIRVCKGLEGGGDPCANTGTGAGQRVKIFSYAGVELINQTNNPVELGNLNGN